jgi:transcriptional regulator with XRE-family HTH domain
MRYQFSGARFKAAREAAGLTREEVAVLIGRSVTTVQFVETDKHEPGAGKAATLAAAVGVRVDDLLVPVDEPAVVAK